MEKNIFLANSNGKDNFCHNDNIYKPNKQIKKQFIERQMEHLRLVQDCMILLEINKDELPFEVDDWKILQRGMEHDLDKFSDRMANNYSKLEEDYNNKQNGVSNDYIDEKELYNCSKLHYLTQRHHVEYHEKNNEPFSNVDICEMCCDIFANSLRNKDESKGKKYCIEKLFPENPFLKDYENNIIKILDLLSFIYQI